MKIITLEEYLKRVPKESFVVCTKSLDETKNIQESEYLFGVIVSNLLPKTTIDFYPTKCSCLEEHEDIQQRIARGDIFLRIKNTKIKYFLSSEGKTIAKSFEKAPFQFWKNFYLETLSQVFSPEA